MEARRHVFAQGLQREESTIAKHQIKQRHLEETKIALVDLPDLCEWHLVTMQWLVKFGDI